MTATRFRHTLCVRSVATGALSRRFGACLFAATFVAGCGPGDAPDDFAFFRLVEGTRVRMEVTAISAAPEGSTASFLINDTLLDQPGDSVEIGEALEGLHVHGTWQATTPGPVAEELSFSMSFRLTTDSELYEDSEEITAFFAVVDEDHDDDDREEEEDGHDHEGDEDEEEEIDMPIASTAFEAGRLTLQYDLAADPVEISFNQCLGANDEPCTGGTILYSGSQPGFAPKE
jgi:hypothetical protein